MIENSAQILSTAIEASKAAAEIIINLFNNTEIDEKGTNNLVTEADVRSEKAIKEIILKNFPDHSILGEESGGETNYDVDSLWVIDPLDGTNNYACSYPFFAISIAYAEKGEVQVGLILDPLRNESFHAVKCKGAFLNNSPIEVSNRKLNQAIVMTGFYYDRGDMMRKTLASIQRLFENNIRGLRRTGSAALDLCYVAAGRADAYIEYALHSWDFAAGMLILDEAGGECRQADGMPLTLKSNTIAVCNGVFSDELLELVRYTKED